MHVPSSDIQGHNNAIRSAETTSITDSAQQKLSELLEYRFTDRTLLEDALTHPMLTKAFPDRGRNNQRLEFLGDSVLNMVVSEMVFKMFPVEQEGALSKRKVGLICTDTLSVIAKKFSLGEYITQNNCPEITNGILENTMEALIGAIFLDGGFEKVKQFISQNWKEFAMNSCADADSKTALQNWTTKNKLPLPIYRVLSNSGPPHLPNFTVSAKVKHLEKAVASATSKKEAEQNAAKMLLEKIKENGISFGNKLDENEKKAN